MALWLWLWLAGFVVTWPLDADYLEHKEQVARVNAVVLGGLAAVVWPLVWLGVLVEAGLKRMVF